ncbi:MAG: hypothetical protein QOF36_2347 [Microbacteriaceae bacterium]|jgi:DNA-binding MarR family transcriptional regulator|nr:hypothetical protein [Microbacteriaceae bacterium]MDQ1731343.1 hypothetical protein [Pseudonocardiales bacterium]
MVDDRDDALPDHFWAAARRLRHLSRETLAPWDVSPSHGRALGVLMRHGSLRLGDLSEQLRIAARSTTEVVDALEARGLVRREPDPEDRRATLVVLTDQGRAAGRAIRAARSAEAEKFFGGLSQTDRTNLLRILRKLNG